jgi:subtilisin family serine protease
VGAGQRVGRPDLAANDPFLSSSGSWGQPYADLWGILRVRAPEAWDLSQGEGVIAAVVDTGIDAEHPDLAANLWVNPGEDRNGNGRIDPEDENGVDDDGNGFVDDLHGFDFANSVDANGDGDYDDPGDVSDADPFDDFGHGTHVAGTIAAVANNGIGVAGVAPRARLMALKGFRTGGSTPDAVLARAMVYAADNGARVINNSWSCSTRCPTNRVLEVAQEYARVARCRRRHLGGQQERRGPLLQPEVAPRQHRRRCERRQRSARDVHEHGLPRQRGRAGLG